MNEQNARTQEHRGRELSLAVKCYDAFTGEEADGAPELTLANHYEEPVRNLSGYWVFIDMDTDVEAVTLEVDGGREYFDVEKRVVLPPGDPDDHPDADLVVTDPQEEPVEIDLTPTPAYPFDGDSTHIKGIVTDGEEQPVEGASVSVKEFGLSTRTTAEGEFAILLPVESDDVVKHDGTKRVKVNGEGRRTGSNGSSINGGYNGNGIGNGNGGNDPTFEVSHPDYAELSERIEIEPGKRTVRYVTLE